MLFLQVIICITLVIFIGSSLSQSADILAEKTGMGRTWVGTILLAGVTSLPELATGTSAIILFNSPDLAVGASWAVVSLIYSFWHYLIFTTDLNPYYSERRLVMD